MLIDAPGSKEIGMPGDMLTIENPGVESLIDVICSVETVALYRLRVSVY